MIGLQDLNYLFSPFSFLRRKIQRNGGGGGAGFFQIYHDKKIDSKNGFPNIFLPRKNGEAFLLTLK